MNELVPLEIEIDFEKAKGLTREALEHFILELEEKLKTFPQTELPLDHYHANAHSDDGVYARKLHIPKGCLLTGRIHRLQCINIVTKGEVGVISIDGIMNLRAGDMFVSSPGAKRVILALEDSEWVTVHATGETDLKKIEQKFTVNNFDELQNKEVLKLEDKVCLLS